MVTCCKVTGTNTPTQKTHLLCVGDENSKMVAPRASVCRKNRGMIIVFVFVVQCLTQHAGLVLLLRECGGWFVSNGFVLVVLASRVRPVPFRSR